MTPILDSKRGGIPPLISCSGVGFSYNGFFAVENISFDLYAGDYLSILGENGSGKTTLMKGLLGLIKSSRGSITYSGIKPDEVGYIPQQSGLQRDFPATVWEVAISGCQNRLGFPPFYSKADKETALENLRYMRAEHLVSRPYRNLSGGQRQRVLLARALNAAGKLLMLDEPVSGLDPSMAERMYGILGELNTQKNITIVMISHDMEGALKHSGKILHLSRGGNFFGSKDEYLSSDIRKSPGGRYV
jgi:zinc transport system ATP-binding protein